MHRHRRLFGRSAPWNRGLRALVDLQGLMASSSFESAIKHELATHLERLEIQLSVIVLLLMSQVVQVKAIDP